MAYFDDHQNREAWEKVMIELRAERERRSSGAAPSAFASTREESFGKQIFREPVTFDQLEKEERAAVTASRIHDRTRSIERDMPEPPGKTREERSL